MRIPLEVIRGVGTRTWPRFLHFRARRWGGKVSPLIGLSSRAGYGGGGGATMHRSSVGKLLKSYRTGKLPQAFKILPSLRNWEEILALTAPEVRLRSLHALAEGERKEREGRGWHWMFCEKCQRRLRSPSKGW